MAFTIKTSTKSTSKPKFSFTKPNLGLDLRKALGLDSKRKTGIKLGKLKIK